MKRFIVKSLIGVALIGFSSQICAQRTQQLEPLTSSVSSSYTSPEHSLLYINDGKQLSTSPYWSNYRDRKHFGVEDYVEYQWTASVEISRISIVWKVAGDSLLLPSEAYFSVWNGKEWTRICDVAEPSAGGVSTTLETFVTSRLRLYARSAAAIGIIELSVYGNPYQEPFDPDKGFRWSGYLPTLDYDFRTEYPSLPAPTKGRLPENVNVAKQVDGEWWSVAVGPNANSLITEESMRLLVWGGRQTSAPATAISVKFTATEAD